MNDIFNKNGYRNVAEKCRKLPKLWYISVPRMAVFCRLQIDFLEVHVFETCNHQNIRPTRNPRNLTFISNIPDFISSFFFKNSPILPKCFRNFFCVLGLISKHKIYLFLPLQVAYVFFYKQFFYSFVRG